jgi:U2 small nuclear ribonucleoprotein B''
VDIVAKKSLKRKGQAFIIYDNVDSAQNAIDDLQGFDLFGQQMSLDFAKTRSDATVHREDGDQGLEVHKKQRLAEKGMYTMFLQAVTPRSLI